MSELNKKVVSATKWSTLTEFASKLIAPISTMVLARVLTPEAFGVMVTATMVISFAEVFTDAGFQKYIVQHDFSDEKTLFRSTNVAFWSNLTMSLAIWLIIIIFSADIAELVGNKGRGDVIAVSCVCIPMAAFSSIQMAIYRRHFDFKTLFVVRMVGIAIPLFITIPLALWLRSYWALIIGMIGLNLSNAIILTVKSRWKPRLEFDFKLLKEMFSFTIWSMLEAISIWATSYVDMFIVGTMLNEYYLGLYRTSMSTVGQITSVITAATTPVLFSTLSRLQSDRQEFDRMFLKFQKTVGLLIIPLGVGMFIFSDVVVEILLGSQWTQAAHFIGLWALTSAATIVLAHYSSEVYRSLGKPRISFFVQLSHIAVLAPAVLIAVGYGFEVLCDVRALIRLELVLANFIFMYLVVKMSPWKMMRNVTPEFFAAAMMCLVMLLPVPSSILLKITYILIACALYFGTIIWFPKERNILFNLKHLLKRK